MPFKRLRGRLDQIQHRTNATLDHANEVLAQGGDSISELTELVKVLIASIQGNSETVQAVLDEIDDGVNFELEWTGDLKDVLKFFAGGCKKLPLRVRCDPYEGDEEKKT